MAVAGIPGAFPEAGWAWHTDEKVAHYFPARSAICLCQKIAYVGERWGANDLGALPGTPRTMQNVPYCEVCGRILRLKLKRVDEDRKAAAYGLPPLEPPG